MPVMRRATITIPDDLEKQLDEYLERQEAPPSLTALVQAALRSYLREKRFEEMEFQPPTRPLRITPAEKGSGLTDVSIRHDEYLADDS